MLGCCAERALSASDASSANVQFVSPPWLCRVNRIWFLPGGDASGSSSYKEVKGTLPEVQQWERRQIADGRVAAQHFQLQVGIAMLVMCVVFCLQAAVCCSAGESYGGAVQSYAACCTVGQCGVVKETSCCSLAVHDTNCAVPRACLLVLCPC
jgi:hypothetical protein